MWQTHELVSNEQRAVPNSAGPHSKRLLEIEVPSHLQTPESHF